jgi:predicted Fe-Mo cluster-binding NifX family protein
MEMGRLKMAVATQNKGGLNDEVSEVFGRAETFTIVEVEEGQIENLEILENPGLSYKHGTGPIIVKLLVDSGVDLVVGPELGHGAKELLEQHRVAAVVVEPGTSVEESVKKTLSDL